MPSIERNNQSWKGKKDVFINCPFDSDYEDLFNALTFAIIDCGFIPRCSKENLDSTPRLDFIKALIKRSELSIHDISRSEITPNSPTVRFNMPFELGLFIGAKMGKTKSKFLVLDAIPYVYQKTVSDLSGIDIGTHENNELKLITLVTNWLTNIIGNHYLDGNFVFDRHQVFKQTFREKCAEKGWDINSMEKDFLKYRIHIAAWIEENKNENFQD